MRELLRLRIGRVPQPRTGIVDSQSAKTTGGEQRGFDGGKKVCGRKRHLLSRRSVGLRHRRFPGFSDSFRRGFSEVRVEGSRKFSIAPSS